MAFGGRGAQAASTYNTIRDAMRRDMDLQAWSVENSQSRSIRPAQRITDHNKP
jgi:hypothetical protein